MKRKAVLIVPLCMICMVAFIVPTTLAPAKIKTKKAAADASITIQIGGDEEFDALDDRYEKSRLKEEIIRLKRLNKKLHKRVKQLERAMIQVQQRLSELEGGGSTVVVAKAYGCSIKTSFKGTFFANGVTQTEAVAKVLKKCEKAGSAFCNERDVKCEKAE